MTNKILIERLRELAGKPWTGPVALNALKDAANALEQAAEALAAADAYAAELDEALEEAERTIAEHAGELDETLEEAKRTKSWNSTGVGSSALNERKGHWYNAWYKSH